MIDENELLKDLEDFPLNIGDNSVLGIIYAETCKKKFKELIDRQIKFGEWINIKEHQPRLEGDDVLLLIKDTNGEIYHGIGYYRGQDDDGDYMFDNCRYGWIQGKVIGWKNINP